MRTLLIASCMNRSLLRQGITTESNGGPLRGWHGCIKGSLGPVITNPHLVFCLQRYAVADPFAHSGSMSCFDSDQQPAWLDPEQIDQLSAQLVDQVADRRGNTLGRGTPA